MNIWESHVLTGYLCPLVSWQMLALCQIDWSASVSFCSGWIGLRWCALSGGQVLLVFLACVFGVLKLYFFQMLMGSWSGYSCTLYLQFIQLWGRGFFGYGSFNQQSPSHVGCSKFESIPEDWKVLRQSWIEHWMFEPLATSFLLRAYIVMRMRWLIISLSLHQFMMLE